VAGAALVAVAIALAATGPHLASLYSSSGLATCASSCGAKVSTFTSQVHGSVTGLIFYGGVVLVYALPPLIGVFWGAPLIARELESGTFRLAWNQTVTRRRWIQVKLGLVGLASMAAAGLLSLMISWWASPLYRAAEQASQTSLSINRFTPLLFGANGIAPIGYAAFAFALGVTIGLLLRRTLAAMAITIAVVAAIQVLWPAFVRPHLVPSEREVRPLSAVNFNGTGDYNNGILVLQVGTINGLPSDTWITGSHPVNAAGQPIAKAPLPCVSAQNFVPCLQSHGVRMAVTYQPPSRYWEFQWLETGIFLVLAGGLGGACYWRIRRLA
jgi:hypothetical protein